MLFNHKYFICSYLMLFTFVLSCKQVKKEVQVNKPLISTTVHKTTSDTASVALENDSISAILTGNSASFNYSSDLKDSTLYNGFNTKKYNILYSIEGDLNNDKVADKIIILNYNEAPNKIVKRKLAILIKQTNSQYLTTHSNDKIIFPNDEREIGVMDPFQEIEIKNNGFQIVQYGGLEHNKWQTEVHFNYDKKLNDWYLYSIKSNAVKTEIINNEPVKTLSVKERTKEDFGTILFKNFDYEKFREDL